MYSEVRYLNLAQGVTETRGVYLAIESVAQATRAIDDSVYILMRRVSARAAPRPLVARAHTFRRAQSYWPSLEVNEPDNVAYNTSAFTQLTRRFWEIYYIANETAESNALGPMPPPELRALVDPVAELRRRMNITQYMTWLAINTRMQVRRRAPCRVHTC